MELLFLAFGIFAITVIVGILVSVRLKSAPPLLKNPKGYFSGLGIGLGLGVGMPIGIATGYVLDSIPLGITIAPSIGVGLGLVIAAWLESRYHHHPVTYAMQEGTTYGSAITLSGMLVLFAGTILFVWLIIG